MENIGISNIVYPEKKYTISNKQLQIYINTLYELELIQCGITFTKTV